MIFQSKYKEHRLIVTAQRVEMTNFGRNLVAGKTIEFKNSLFETEDKKEIEFIKKHPSFGIDIVEIPSVKEQEDALIKKAEEIKAQREDKVSAVEEMVKKAKK